MTCSVDHLISTGLTQTQAEALCAEFSQDRRDLGAAPVAVSATDVGTSVDIFFMLICAYLVFFMQAGFAMVRFSSLYVPPTAVTFSYPYPPIHPAEVLFSC